MCNLCLEPTAVINFIDLTVKTQYGCELQEPQRDLQKISYGPSFYMQ